MKRGQTITGLLAHDNEDFSVFLIQPKTGKTLINFDRGMGDMFNDIRWALLKLDVGTPVTIKCLASGKKPRYSVWAEIA